MSDRRVEESSARSKGPKTLFTKSASTAGSLKEVANPRGSYGGGYGRDQYEGRYGGYGRGGGYLEDAFGGSYGGGRGEGYGGSPYGVGGRKHDSAELYHRKQMANKRMEESSERAVMVLSDTLQSGKKIAVEVDRQAEALGRTERRLDEILEQPKRHKQSKSPFGSGKNEVPMRNDSLRGPETVSPHSLAHLPSTGNARVDTNLDILSEGLHDLKQVAEHIGEQLDHTTAQAGRVQYKTHQTDAKMKEANKQIREQLARTSAQAGRTQYRTHQTDVKIRGDIKRHL